MTLENFPTAGVLRETVKRLIDEVIIDFEEYPFKHKDEQVQRKFGARLREIRRKKGYSLEGLARQVNIDKSYLSRTERGIGPISRDAATAIADELRISRFDLLVEGGWIVVDQERITPEELGIFKRVIDTGLLEITKQGIITHRELRRQYL